MKGLVIKALNSNDNIILINGILLLVHCFEKLSQSKNIEMDFIPFISTKISKNVLFKYNSQNEKKLILDSLHCSYQAYGKIVGNMPLIIDFGSVELEIDYHDLDEEVTLSELYVGRHIYLYIDRLDIEELTS